MVASISWSEPSYACQQTFFQLDNDFTLLRDEGYSNGMRLGCGFGDGDTDWNLMIGHAIHTPADLARSTLDRDDQVYASHAYLQGAMLRKDQVGYSRLDLQIGLVGAANGGEVLQKAAHKVTDFERPRGWDQQIGHEATASLRLGRMWHQDIATSSWNADWFPHASVTLGNVITGAQGGFLARLGSFAESQRPPVFNSLNEPPGAAYQMLLDGDYVFFAGIDGRFVARDMFFDGPVFSNGHTVEKRPAVLALRIGAETSWQGLALGFTQTFHSSLFQGDDPHGYGTFFVGISW